MEDYVNPAKDIDSDNYWISVKCPKAMTALRRAFPQAECMGCPNHNYQLTNQQ